MWFSAVVALLMCAFAPLAQSSAQERAAFGFAFPFDPELEVQTRSFADSEALQQLTIFPRHQVPQISHIDQLGAVAMAVNVERLALLPGDRLVLRDTTNATTITITASNQTATKRALCRPKPVLWNHPFLMVGSRVTIEYWPSLMTLVLPINRKQLDNPVVVVESLTFAIRRRPRLPRIGTIGTMGSGTDLGDGEGESLDTSLESQIGATNEMKPAVCYKKNHPQMYSKARAVARLIIERAPQRPPGIVATLGHPGLDDGLDEGQSYGHPREMWTFCTGWLVGRGNHMLTNYHCFYQLSRSPPGIFPAVQAASSFRIPAVDSECSSASSGLNDQLTSKITRQIQTNVDFMAESKTCSEKGTMGKRTGQVDATSVTIVAANQSLDYVLLRVDPSGTAGSNSTDLAKTFGYLTLRESGPVDGEPVYIPQHPNGKPKTIASVKDGQPAVIHVLKNGTRASSTGSSSFSFSSDGGASLMFDNVSVWYNADTAPGSSGSPVLSQRDNTVVALHHAGPGLSSSIQSDGWAARLVGRLRGGSGDGNNDPSIYSPVRFNLGIRIDAIVDDLREQGALPPCALAVKCDGTDTANDGKTNKKNKKKKKAKAVSPCCLTTW